MNALFGVLRMVQVLATGGADGRVKVWNISGFDGTRYADDDMRQDEAMLETAHWQAHAGVLTSIEYVPKGRMLVTAAQVSDREVPCGEVPLQPSYGDTVVRATRCMTSLYMCPSSSAPRRARWVWRP